MTLDSIVSGAKGHVQGFLDSDTRRLATVLCLPLVDGVFATMLVSGSLNAVSQMLSVAVTIFAGAGALAVVFSMKGSGHEVRKKVFKASTVLMVGTTVVALIAPIYRELVAVSLMREVAAIALVLIAGKMSGLSAAEKVPVPVVVVTGLLLALKQPSGIRLSISYLLPAIATVSAASAVLLAATYISSDVVDLSVMRKGAAAVLIIVAVSMLGVSTPSSLTVMTLSATLILAIDTPLRLKPGKSRLVREMP